MPSIFTMSQVVICSEEVLYDYNYNRNVFSSKQATEEFGNAIDLSFKKCVSNLYCFTVKKFG